MTWSPEKGMMETTKRLKTMNDNVFSNITQLLTSFDSFVKIVEDSEWIKSATIEDIKSAFKLGNLIEKIIEHFSVQNSLEKFLSVLTKWWKNTDRTKIYNSNFYSLACDEIFIRFFRASNNSEKSLDIVVRVYTSIQPKERFENVLVRLLSESGNFETISQYVTATFSKNEAKCLEYNLILQHWDFMLQIGQIECIKEEVGDMLTSYNIEIHLHVLLGILTLTDLSNSQKDVQNIILNCILEKMSDRSILTQQFWTTLCKDIDIKNICLVCLNFEDYFKSFLNFIIYIGSMMIKIGNVWKVDPNNCFYPDIEYEHILVCILELAKTNEKLKECVLKRLNESKEFADIWHEILNVLCKR